MHNTKLRALLFCTALSAAAYALWVSLSEPKKIAQAFHTVGLQGALIIFGLSLLNYGLRFIRYHSLMKTMGDHVPFWSNLLYYLAGFALTTTPGKTGESVRYIYLKPYNVTLQRTIAVLLTERFFDLIAIWMIALLGAWVFVDYRWTVLLSAALCIIMLIILQHPILHQKLQCWSKSHKSTTLHKCSAFTLHTLTTTKTLLQIKPMSAGLLIGLMAWGAEALGFVYLISLLDYNFQPLILTAVYAVSMLVGALSFLPGGLGSAEMTMHILLITLGVNPADSIGATLICRIATLWFAVAIGAITMLYLAFFQRHGPSSITLQHKDHSRP